MKKRESIKKIETGENNRINWIIWKKSYRAMNKNERASQRIKVNEKGTKKNMNVDKCKLMEEENEREWKMANE